MLPFLFESRERARNDAREVRHLQNQYGDELLSVLKQRANDTGLTPRDRKHWDRLLRKASRAA